jgi:isoamyl acetate esterase
VRAIRAPESQWYSPETRVLLITPPPIHIPSMGVDMQPMRTFDVTKAYAEEVKKVGEAENVPVVDVWTVIWEAAGKSKETVKGFLTDGLHLGKAGYEVSITTGIVFFRLCGDPTCRSYLLLWTRQ